jgi:hypothetical protein
LILRQAQDDKLFPLTLTLSPKGRGDKNCKILSIRNDGSEAKVMEPENLRKEIIAELTATRKQYT